MRLWRGGGGHCGPYIRRSIHTKVDVARTVLHLVDLDLAMGMKRVIRARRQRHSSATLLMTIRCNDKRGVRLRYVSGCGGFKRVRRRGQAAPSLIVGKRNEMRM